MAVYLKASMEKTGSAVDFGTPVGQETIKTGGAFIPTRKVGVSTLNGSEYFIQYSTNCSNKNTPNRLIRSFVFMSAIANMKVQANGMETSLVPEGLILSVESKLTSAMPVVKGLVSPANFGTCIGADYRFLAFKYVGPSISTILKSNGFGLDFTMARNVFKSMLVELKILHDYGIVHGDLSWDNVLISQTGGLKFIGFERSTFVKDTVTVTAPSKYGPEFWAPHELLQPATTSAPSFGGDLYRVYEMLGAMLAGPDFYNGLALKSLPELRNIKANANWIVTLENVDNINKHFNREANLLHFGIQEALKTPANLPNYDALIAMMDVMMQQ